MKKVIVAISIIAILVTAGLAFGQGWGRGSGGGYGGYGPCASGYAPVNASAWCPRFTSAPGQAQGDFAPAQQARLNSSQSGRNYGPGYGMRGGMGYGWRTGGYGCRAGVNSGSGSWW